MGRYFDKLLPPVCGAYLIASFMYGIFYGNALASGADIILLAILAVATFWQKGSEK